MEGIENELEHPKKRRRRFYSQRLLSAHLVVDEDLRQVAAVISDDLWSDFFGHFNSEKGTFTQATVEIGGH